MKIRIAIVTVLTIILSATPASSLRAQQPILKTDRQVYLKNEQITVEFSGLPGSQTDWITIVPVGSPVTLWGQWAYTKGQRAGTMKFVAGGPGEYEVRVFYDYPRGGNVVRSNLKFEVKGTSLSRPLTIGLPSASPVAGSTNKIADKLDQPSFSESGGRIAIPHPLSVALTMDHARSSSADMTLQGGTLTATSSDGTVYTLVIPRNALYKPEHIVMTPISKLTGMPVKDGTPGGVHLEPDGLRLYNFAQLTIKPAREAKGVPLSFSCGGSGQEFHLYPQDIKTDILSFHILHFSGLVVYMGDNLQLPVAPESFVPSGPEAQLEHSMEREILIEKQNQLFGHPDPNFMDKMTDLLKKGYESSIGPMLQRIGTDCDFGRSNMPIALGWAKQAEMLAHDEFPNQLAAVQDANGSMIKSCWKKLTATCLTKFDFETKDDITQVVRLAQLLGFDEAVYNWQAIKWCPSEDPNRFMAVEAWTLTYTVEGSLEYRTMLNEYGDAEEVKFQEHHSGTILLKLTSGGPGDRQYSGTGTVTGTMHLWKRSGGRGETTERNDNGGGETVIKAFLGYDMRSKTYDLYLGDGYIPVSTNWILQSRLKPTIHSTSTWHWRLSALPFPVSRDRPSLPSIGMVLDGAGSRKMGNIGREQITVKGVWRLTPVGNHEGEKKTLSFVN